MNSIIRSPMSAALIGTAAALSIASRTAIAQPLPRGFSEWYSYDAAGGLLPPDQCWARVVQGNRPPATVIGGVLTSLTLPSPAPGQVDDVFEYWERDDVPIDFLQGFVMECRARVIGSDLRFTTGGSWPRPGFTPLYAVDRAGRAFWVGVSNNLVFLANHFFIPLGAPNAVTIPFDPTDAEHLYRLDVSAAGATLSIDGTPRLTVPLGPAGLSTRLVLFADATTWANADVQILSARFATGVPPCPGDTNGDRAVGLADIAVLIENWARAVPLACTTADLDSSGSIGLGDIAIVTQNWDTSCP